MLRGAGALPRLRVHAKGLHDKETWLPEGGHLQGKLTRVMLFAALGTITKRFRTIDILCDNQGDTTLVAPGIDLHIIHRSTRTIT